MDVFDLRKRLVDDYASYTRSFIKIADPTILAKVDSELDAGAFWPEPLLQLNPTFQPGGTIDDLVSDGTLHPECARIFRIDKTQSELTGKQLLLHTHQTEGIRKAKENKSYVLTSGTGSGKSLTYIVPIVDHVLRRGSGQGIQAIVVYPMNALANSQDEELGKFLKQGYPEGKPPVRFARYTGPGVWTFLARGLGSSGSFFLKRRRFRPCSGRSAGCLPWQRFADFRRAAFAAG
jgi:ATP-dependent helicase YprA (DUF1998 family)